MKKINLDQTVTKRDAQNFATKADLKQFATKADLQQFATKDDFKRLENLLHTAIDMIFKRFDVVDEELAKKADKADIARIENKLDPTIDRVDDHERRIKKLEPVAGMVT
jgi:hypothetical protein